MTRYIFVTGGVMSGIGKGIAAASIGRILKSKGFKATAIKIDPYINVDAGTMNPVEHGEVFVTDDGLETDQDIGNYERFLNQDIGADNYMTTGRVYETVIRKERNLEYQGHCVEVVPHIPEEVIHRIETVAKKSQADFILIEIGGTVGEYQNMLFLEAARMLHLKKPKQVLFILVSYLPVPQMIGEMKTKPTQYATRSLNSAGIQPDIIIARSEIALDEIRKRKISTFCNIDSKDVISAPDIKTIYQVPLNFDQEKIGERILTKFNLKSRPSDFKAWRKMVNTIKTAKSSVKIGIVGKYFASGNFTLADSYISVIEAVKHAAWENKKQPQIEWLNSEEYEKDKTKLNQLKKLDGIIVPGGYGSRGIKGKLMTIEFARKNKIPYLGLCYGMQLAIIEFAQNVCGLKQANTTEIDPQTKYPVIDFIEDQRAKVQQKKYGGTMRLGAYDCRLTKGTRAQRAYNQIKISERHRHRYEVNNRFRPDLEENGLIISGINPQNNLVEIIELADHPFFVAVQFHPEFKSRPLNPHPLFREFIRTAVR